MNVNATQIALVIPFVLIAIAPFVGRWRANVWLKRHAQRERAAAIQAAEKLA
ncbi:hypothetical protein [Edaphobacter flagellatus]|uniref:hypothetical protein n=1 Tax=Edaphobacter flagellatus TaxID=1933044 RepID=UPI0021B4A2CF|nr:hypothetical protein [Edaphobacter flagellatus]